MYRCGRNFPKLSKNARAMWGQNCCNERIHCRRNIGDTVLLTSENYFLTEHVSAKKKDLKRLRVPRVRSAKRKENCARTIRVYWVRAEKESFFRSTFRIAGRENLAARRRDLLDACRAVLRDLLPTLARFKSRSRAVFAKFITSHWDFSTAVDAAKSLLWKVYSKRRFTRDEAEKPFAPAARRSLCNSVRYTDGRWNKALNV